MSGIHNFLVKRLNLNQEALTATGNVLYLNGEPLLTTADSVLLTGDQYISGKKEFDEAYIYSGQIIIDSLDTEGMVLIDGEGNVSIDWDSHLLYISGVPSLDWEQRLFYKGENFLELETTLDWDNRILSGNWTTQDPVNPNHVATKKYVDDQIDAQSQGGIRLSVPIPSGSDMHYVSHSNLGGPTSIVGSLRHDTGEWHYQHYISGVTNSSFYVVFSDTIDSENYFFDCHVSRI